MKKRILTMLALCATIMCLAACDNEETNTNATGGTTTATVTATPATQKDTSSTEKEPENNVATTVELTATPTVEATVTPTEAPAVPKEVSWEESGMSYELFENPNGTVVVVVTNNDENICCFIVNKYPYKIEPNGKCYSPVFYTIDEATEFVTKLENTTCTQYPYRGTFLTTELTCDVTNETNDKIDFTTDDLVTHFNNSTNLNATWSKFIEAEWHQNLILNDNNTSVLHIIVYNENNEIVAIDVAFINDVICDEIKEEYAYKGTATLPSDLEYSKITMVMQYNWTDGIFE